ncbi:MAG TPA: MBL fold metallo-hydrolase [Acidimicrobiales bacterium]
MTITVTLLGTGSPLPDANRAGPSTLVQSAGTTLLVDCGRGVLMRLSAAGVLPTMLDAVLVTHLHSDHLTDLNDVITTHWVMGSEDNTLTIYGPPRLSEVVTATLAALAPDRQYRLAHHDDLNWEPPIRVVEVEPGDTFTAGGATVHVGRTDHRPVEPTVGYRIEQDGAVVAVAGDSIPCESLDALCAGADAYVQTVIRDDIVRMIPNARLQDILDYHSSVTQAVQTAARAGVGALVLTHYVPPPAPGQLGEWLDLITPHFTGQVVLGDDLTSVTVPLDRA